MTSKRAFSLIELMVVVAIIGVATVMTVAGFRAMASNSDLSGAVLELQARLLGLKAKALSEQRDHVLVLVDGDGTGCRLYNAPGCVRYFIVAGPDAAAWSLNTFDPKKPGLNTEGLVDDGRFEKVLFFPPPAPRFGPPPFGTVRTFDPDYQGACGAAACVAFRFRANGEVYGEQPAPVPQKNGNTLVFATVLEGQAAAADRRAVLVAFPSGIVKTFAF